MPIPLVVWAAAGVGAAGLKMYMNANSPEAVVKAATDRYNEERFKFYKRMEKLLPLVEELGAAKLTTWLCYEKAFALFGSIENLPGHFTYKSHKNLHMLPQTLRKLRKVVSVVKEIYAKHLDKEGTGMLTILALQGGAASDYSQAAMEEGESRLIMEQIMDQPLYTTEVGPIDEEQVLSAVMNFPKVLPEGYFKGMHGKKKISRTEAKRFKSKTDRQSLLLAEAEGRAERLQNVVTHVLTYIKGLQKAHKEQREFLENVVKTKQDYEQFTLEEKDRLNYMVAIGFVLRELTRKDIVIKNGSLAVINSSGLREVYAKASDLMPQEALPYQG
jgi:hypothetical protein